ncbi:uncharacterized protein PHALS_00967 [Plasmopara halstedii]|uniref:Uncharacterized protein n=1 Tax=Plasmopara halstedii TaxID=4781 RepID=A0A0P1AUI3_PLAHL|nr:uncharacterized protein PHALS_00967 [Plasmopara halstedii]CEG44621.1 hypothetical protein PHALS_00967 [Plasmopara halstedii]|eukprot:XP_024580990.1 hypothetical protein PHALS_00967 [Plasmopara halstedii]
MTFLGMSFRKQDISMSTAILLPANAQFIRIIDPTFEDLMNMEEETHSLADEISKDSFAALPI